MALAAANSKLFARASLFLVGLMFVLPFLQPYHRYPIPSFYSEWLAFALGLAAALVLLGRQPWSKAELPAVIVAPIALIVILGLQALMGRAPYVEQILTAVLYLLWAALLLQLGFILRREFALNALATTLAWFLLAGGLLSAVVGILQHFHVSTVSGLIVKPKVTAEIFGNLGQANHYAAHLTIAMACAVFLYGRGRIGVTSLVASAVILLPPLAWSGSRSAWLYLAVLAALATLLYEERRDAESRRLAIVTLMFLPALAVAQWMVPVPQAIPTQGDQVAPSDRIFQIVDGLERRIQLWREAWEMFLGAPLLGAGFGRFAWHHFVTTAAGSASSGPKLFNHAHNIVLQLMAETGAIGAAVVIGALLLWLADLRRAVVSLSLEWWWLLALISVIGIHSMLEHPLWYSYFLGMAALLLGFGARRLIVLRLAAATRALFGLAIIAGWFNLATVLPPYREFERLVFTPVREGLRPLGEESFSKAIVGLYREPLLVPYVDLAIAISVTVSEDRLEEKLALTTRAVHFAPLPAVSYRYAILLALAGEREAALAQLERSLRVYPEEASQAAQQLELLARGWPSVIAPLLESIAAVSKRPARTVTQ